MSVSNEGHIFFCVDSQLYLSPKILIPHRKEAPSGSSSYQCTLHLHSRAHGLGEFSYLNSINHLHVVFTVSLQLDL